jgi:hypothetical protein
VRSSSSRVRRAKDVSTVVGREASLITQGN